MPDEMQSSRAVGWTSALRPMMGSRALWPLRLSRRRTRPAALGPELLAPGMWLRVHAGCGGGQRDRGGASEAGRRDELIEQGERKVAFRVGGPLVDGVRAVRRGRDRELDALERLDEQAGRDLVVLGDQDARVREDVALRSREEVDRLGRRGRHGDRLQALVRRPRPLQPRGELERHVEQPPAPKRVVEDRDALEHLGPRLERLDRRREQAQDVRVVEGVCVREDGLERLGRLAVDDEEAAGQAGPHALDEDGNGVDRRHARAGERRDDE